MCITFHHLLEFVCARQPFKLKPRAPLPLGRLNTILRAIAVAKAETKVLVGTTERAKWNCFISSVDWF